MKLTKPHPEVRGTRTGYVIRYTCPVCVAESVIVNNSPKDHFKNSRVVSCRHCRTRVNVMTPGRDA